MKIVAMVTVDRFISTGKMAETIGISTTAIENNISKLKEMGVIRRVGPDRGGYWEVVKDE